MVLNGKHYHHHLRRQVKRNIITLTKLVSHSHIFIIATTTKSYYKPLLKVTVNVYGVKCPVSLYYQCIHVGACATAIVSLIVAK